jgi:hypothetical protein
MTRRLIYLLLSLLLVGASWAQSNNDALSPDEIDQIRDAAQEPGERLKLYIKFARQRLDTAEQSRTDPKVKDHAAAIHDELQDFLSIYDEMDENVDTYADRNDDVRKGLKAVIEADTEFQMKLRSLQEATAASQDKDVYQFVLTNSLEDVDDGAQDHRELLAKQEEAAKHRKKREKAD